MAAVQQQQQYDWPTAAAPPSIVNPRSQRILDEVASKDSIYVPARRQFVSSLYTSQKDKRTTAEPPVSARPLSEHPPSQKINMLLPMRVRVNPPGDSKYNNSGYGEKPITKHSDIAKIGTLARLSGRSSDNSSTSSNSSSSSRSGGSSSSSKRESSSSSGSSASRLGQTMPSVLAPPVVSRPPGRPDKYLHRNDFVNPYNQQKTAFSSGYGETSGLGTMINVTSEWLGHAACAFMGTSNSHHEGVGPKYFNSASQSLYGSLYPANSPRLEAGYTLSTYYYPHYPELGVQHQRTSYEYRNKNRARPWSTIGRYHQPSANIRAVIPVPPREEYGQYFHAPHEINTDVHE
jgi:hypothetical protein